MPEGSQAVTDTGAPPVYHPVPGLVHHRQRAVHRLRVRRARRPAPAAAPGPRVQRDAAGAPDMALLYSGLFGHQPHARRPRDAPRHQACKHLPGSKRMRQAGRPRAGESLLRPDVRGHLKGGHPPLHVARGARRPGLRVEVRHLVFGLPAVRTGHAPLPLQGPGRQGQPVLFVQEDLWRAIRTAARPLLGAPALAGGQDDTDRSAPAARHRRDAQGGHGSHC
mmetsp:Transcript_37241/g.119715  ORF Transcript_37241/g.119715 Transcript_37241/m.119715 type:complete len:222 (+) Transcript_37241:312-977(+)